MTASNESVKHHCQPFSHSTSLRCVSLTDSKMWFNLMMPDGASLLVRYCPFCGTDAQKLNNERFCAKRCEILDPITGIDI